MSKKSLQSSVNRILVLTFSVVAAGAIILTYGYSEVQKTWSSHRIADELLRGASDQTEALLPSFLLPEQQAGVPLLLERIGKAEKLDQIRVVKNTDEIANMYPECARALAATSCSSTNGSMIGVISPINIQGKQFGFLFKARKKHTEFLADNWVQALEAAGFVLLFAFIILFWRMYRLMSKLVPQEHSETLRWIEADLNGKSLSTPKSSFQELEDLRNGIAEILERYERSRDQAAVGQLTSGIMHDLKTPLSSVVTATLLVAEQTEGSQKRLARLENLFSVCQARMPVIGGIIESTLDGSREIHLDKSESSLADTVGIALALNNDLIVLRKAHVNVTSHPSNDLVSHDSIQISRVLSNLIKNAIEARPVGTQIEIHVTLAGDGNATVSVEDNGPGISENPNRIFRVFRSSKAHGSGLGLIISRRIVEAHQGKLEYRRSAKLGGARFELHLPIERKSEVLA
jgi:signal transduction histidine kinase